MGWLWTNTQGYEYACVLLCICVDIYELLEILVEYIIDYGHLLWVFFDRIVIFKKNLFYDWTCGNQEYLHNHTCSGTLSCGQFFPFRWPIQYHIIVYAT